MVRYFYRDLSPCPRKYAAMFLAFFWIAGMICGAGLYVSAGDVTASLMRMAVCSPVSIVDLLISIFLPFLFSAFAVYIDMPGLLTVIAFVKAASLAFFSQGTLSAFGNAGWLVRVLLMFSDICTTVVLYLYWMRHISGQHRFSAIRFSAYCAAALLIGSFDHCYIAPFLVKIIEF